MPRSLSRPALGVLLVLSACADDSVRGRSDAPESAGALSDAAVATAAGDVVDTVLVPAAGTWTARLAENKMRSNDLTAVRQRRDVRRPGISVVGTRYQVGSAALELFIYGDVIARGRDTDVLDLSRVAPDAPAAPLLITDGNMAALLFVADSALARRVRGALRTEPDDGPLRPASGNPDRPARARR